MARTALYKDRTIRSLSHTLSKTEELVVNSMKKNRDGWDTSLENLSAELTEAAYPAVLRQGVGSNWLDLELDMWKALTATVKSWARDSRLCVVRGE